MITADCENNETAVEMIRKFVKSDVGSQSKGTPQFEALIVKSRDTRSDYGIHAKVYVIDGDYAVTGSANLTVNGLSNNIELLIIHDPSEAPEIESKFNEIWALYEREPNTEKLQFGTRAVQESSSQPSPPASDLSSKEKPGRINQENLELGMAFEAYVRGLLTVDFEVLASNKEDRDKEWGGSDLFDFRIRDIVQGGSSSLSACTGAG